MLALADEHPTGVFDFYSNPSITTRKRTASPEGRLSFLAEMEGFEPPGGVTRQLISSVVRLWQIHVWSRSLRAASSNAGNPGAARDCGHSNPFRPKLI